MKRQLPYFACCQSASFCAVSHPDWLILRCGPSTSSPSAPLQCPNRSSPSYRYNIRRMRIARLLMKSFKSEQEIPPQSLPGGTVKPFNTESQFMQQFEKHIMEVDQLPLTDQFKGLIDTLRGLLLVVAQRKQQFVQFQKVKLQDEEMRNRVANHSSIIASLEEMYEGRLVELREESQARISQIQGAYERQRRTILALKKQSEEKGDTINKLIRQIASLNEQIRNLSNQNEFLLGEIERGERDLSSLQSIIKGTCRPNIELLDVSRNRFQVLLQSSSSETICSYLTPSELLRLRLVNRRANYILRHHEPLVRLLATAVLRNARALRRQSIKEVKAYEGMLEAFPEQKIRQWSLKYLYFKVRPGEYLGQVLADLTSEQAKKLQSSIPKAPQRKRSALSSLLFGQEKKQDRKLSIRDFDDEASVQRLKSRLQEFFEGIVRFDSPSSLQQFRVGMAEQLKELKEATTQANKISALAIYSKYLYLEAQDLAHLGQFLFSLLLKETRRANTLQSECQDQKEGLEALRKILAQLSEQKHRMEQSSWKAEIQSSKYRNQNARLEESIQSTKKHLERLEHDNKQLTHSWQHAEKKWEQATKRLKHFESQFEGIHLLLAQNKHEEVVHRERSATNASAHS